MTTVLVVAAALLTVAALLILVRLFRGPTLYDRLVALDTLVVVLVCLVAVWSVHRDAGSDIVLLAVVVLVGMLSSLTAARLGPEEDRS